MDDGSAQILQVRRCQRGRHQLVAAFSTTSTQRLAGCGEGSVHGGHVYLAYIHHIPGEQFAGRYVCLIRRSLLGPCLLAARGEVIDCVSI